MRSRDAVLSQKEDKVERPVTFISHRRRILDLLPNRADPPSTCSTRRADREFALAQQGDSSLFSLLIRLLGKPESVDLDQGHFIVKRRVLHLQGAKRGRRFKLAVPCAWYRSALAACDKADKGGWPCRLSQSLPSGFGGRDYEQEFVFSCTRALIVSFTSDPSGRPRSVYTPLHRLVCLSIA